MTHFPGDMQSVTVPLQERVGPSVDWGEKKRMNPTSGVRFLSLELRGRLPDICSEHGKAVSERRAGTIRFHQTSRGREQWTLRSVLRKLLHDLFLNWAYPALDVNAVLYGEWPLCADCVRRHRRLRQLGRALLLLGGVILAAAVLSRVAGYEQFSIPLFVAFFPFWLPGGVLAAILAFGAAQRFVRCEPLTDEGMVAIRAHPDFAAAFRRRMAGPGAE